MLVPLDAGSCFVRSMEDASVNVNYTDALAGSDIVDGVVPCYVVEVFPWVVYCLASPSEVPHHDDPRFSSPPSEVRQQVVLVL